MNSNNALPGSMRGLQATFYKGPKPIFNKDNLTELQDFYTVSNLDLDWGDRAPGRDLPADNFSAVFEGKLIADQPGKKTYNLYANTDGNDGIRLYVGDKKLIDTWASPKAGDLKASVSLTGGQAEDIRVEYKDGGKDAKFKLEWESDGLAREVIPEDNFARHGYGSVDETNLLTLRVAANGSNNVGVIKSPTQADYGTLRARTYGSIQDAVDQAEALMNTGQGVKIAIEPGEYRVSDYNKYGIVLGESHAYNADDFELNALGREAPLVIEGTAPGVKILGSQRWQEGWQDLGNGVYKHDWTEDWGFEIQMPGGPPTDAITHRREAVFVNGDRLDPVLFRETTYNRSNDSYSFGKQIDIERDLKPGQFTVDEDGDAIFVKLKSGTSINDKIEVAQAEQLFRAVEPKNNLVLRNLEFAHASNRYARNYAWAAVDIGGPTQLENLERSQNIVVENVNIHDNSGTGLRIRKSDDVTVRNSVFNKNGATGITMAHLNGTLFHEVDTEYNNWRGDLGDYRGWFVAGIKNIYSENMTADGFNASNNYAHGYWHDLNVKNTLFTNGITENNSRYGIFIEVSDGPHQVTNSVSRNNGESGVIINTSPNVFLQGNRFVNNGRRNVGDYGKSTRDAEIQVGARLEREAAEPYLPDIVDNITVIDNIVENTSPDPNNHLFGIYADTGRYQDLIRNDLVANHNVYWDKTNNPAFTLRYGKNVKFSEADSQGDRWIDVSDRDGFEAGSVFEAPKTGNSAPRYKGSFSASLESGEDIVLAAEQLGVSDSDTYAFKLKYTLTDTPARGNLRLRGVALTKGDSFSLADVERGWLSYSHEAGNAVDDAFKLQASDGRNTLAVKTVAITVADPDGGSPSNPPAPKPEPSTPPSSGGDGSGGDGSGGGGGDGTPPGPSNPTGDAIRIEAEDMALKGFRVEQRDVFSAGKAASLAGQGSREKGTARTTFDGTTGQYDVVVSYTDESDGVATMEAKLNGASLDTWQLDQNLDKGHPTAKNQVQRVVASNLTLNSGDRLALMAAEGEAEHGRIDYVDLIPVGSGSGGGTPDNGADKDTDGTNGDTNGREALNLSRLKSYGGSRQDRSLETQLSNNNTAVRMEGNGWRRLAVNYTVTPETMLSFDFRSEAEGEFHSVGFDNNNIIASPDRERTFMLFGTQDWGNQDFATYLAQSGWQSFDIPVGEYFQGDMTYLTFGNDHDNITSATQPGMGEFRDVVLYEASDRLGASSSLPQQSNMLQANGDDVLPSIASNGSEVLNA